MSEPVILTVNCPSNHGGHIITGDPTMKIDGKPVARIGDLHSCPMVYPPGIIPHAVTPIIIGVPIPNRPTVNGRLIAFEGDMTTCGAKLLKCGSGNAKGVALIVAGALVGIGLLFLASFLGKKKSKDKHDIEKDKMTTKEKAEQNNTAFQNYINRNLLQRGQDSKNKNIAEENKSTSDNCKCNP